MRYWRKIYKGCLHKLETFDEVFYTPSLMSISFTFLHHLSVVRSPHKEFFNSKHWGFYTDGDYKCNAV